METIKNFFISLGDNYSLFTTILVLVLLIWGIYNRIKFLCLKKASEMVAKAEDKDLSGEEKFALCVIWINEELPKIFRNSLISAIIEKLVDFAYSTSFEYMKKYIKRKTGYNVSELVEQVKLNMDNLEKENDKE